jgi:spermidine/putrescine-binding protein
VHFGVPRERELIWADYLVVPSAARHKSLGFVYLEFLRDPAIAARVSNGEVERTRPVYPYSVMAHYSGSGTPKAAESFVPFDSTINQNQPTERP